MPSQHRCPQNNRWANLREATVSQNCANQRGRRPDGLKGAFLSARSRKKPWQARITIDYKMHFLGNFSTAEEAHAAYVEAAHRLRGEFACAG